MINQTLEQRYSLELDLLNHGQLLPLLLKIIIKQPKKAPFFHNFIPRILLLVILESIKRSSL